MVKVNVRVCIVEPVHFGQVIVGFSAGVCTDIELTERGFGVDVDAVNITKLVQIGSAIITKFEVTAKPIIAFEGKIDCQRGDGTARELSGVFGAVFTRKGPREGDIVGEGGACDNQCGSCY